MAKEKQHKPRTRIIRTTHIDFYANTSASAGTGDMLSDYEDIEEIEVLETPESLQADFALAVHGDSMEPMFSDEDIVLVRKQPMVYEGEIGIFNFDGDGYIKKFGGDRLISLNENYDDIMLSTYKSYCCFGKVIGKAQLV